MHPPRLVELLHVLPYLIGRVVDTPEVAQILAVIPRLRPRVVVALRRLAIGTRPDERLIGVPHFLSSKMRKRVGDDPLNPLNRIEFQLIHK